MHPRDRVLAATSYRAPDVVPLQLHPSPAGLYEHGPKLLDMMRSCGHDFGDASRLTMPEPPGPEDWDADGRYHAFRTDDWGTGWEYRIFGVWGHRIRWPLQDLSALNSYRAPAPPPAEGPSFRVDSEAAEAHKRRFFLLGDGGMLMERMQSLRPFEDVLVDIALDTPEINRIADIIVENAEVHIRRALALGVDAVTFGDDYGSQDRLFMSMEVWRRFFKPRYERLFEPVVRAGKQVFFHCCGYVADLLPDLVDVGVTAIWPQLTAYDLSELAHQCRDLGLTVQLHPDRGELMQNGTPDQVRAYLHRLFEIFDTPAGGSWLYIEIDPGFPFENVRALFETVTDLRHNR